MNGKIEQLIRPSIEHLGYEFWGCEYIAQGKHSLLRIYIDKDTGIGIADCECASRQISAILDVEDPISTEYLLEVSSPGMPRPLFFPAQYQRYIGECVQIKLSKPISGQRKYEGLILSVDETQVCLSIGETSRDFLFSPIVKANLTSK